MPRLAASGLAALVLLSAPSRNPPSPAAHLLSRATSS